MRGIHGERRRDAGRRHLDGSRSLKLRKGTKPIAALALTIALSSGLLLFAEGARRPLTAQVRPGAAPADLTGVWLEKEPLVSFSPKEPPFQKWAEQKYKAAKPGYGPHASANSQDPILQCYPPGVPRILMIPFPVQIVQIPGQVMMVFEYDHFVRFIDLDRRQHPKDLNPTWMGDSIGHWEGDTLVVDTVGLNDRTWLDQVGHPHSDALHLVERIRRTDHDTLVDDITFDDPKAYLKPWDGQQVFALRRGWRLFEYICEDNMADPPR
jgi:hypothetical protein